MERRISQFSNELDTALQSVRKQFRSTLEEYHRHFTTEMGWIRDEFKCPQPTPNLSHLVALEVDKRINEFKREESKKWDGVMDRVSKLEGLVKVCASDERLDASIDDIKQFVNYSCSEEEQHRRALERQVREMQDSISKLRSSPISTSWEQGHDSNSIALQLDRINDRLSRVDKVIAHCCTLDVVEARLDTFRLELVESKSKEYEAKSTKNSRAGSGEPAGDDQRARCDASARDTSFANPSRDMQDEAQIESLRKRVNTLATKVAGVDSFVDRLTTLCLRVQSLEDKSVERRLNFNVGEESDQELDSLPHLALQALKGEVFRLERSFKNFSHEVWEQINALRTYGRNTHTSQRLNCGESFVRDSPVTMAVLRSFVEDSLSPIQLAIAELTAEILTGDDPTEEVKPGTASTRGTTLCVHTPYSHSVSEGIKLENPSTLGKPGKTRDDEHEVHSTLSALVGGTPIKKLSGMASTSMSDTPARTRTPNVM